MTRVHTEHNKGACHRSKAALTGRINLKKFFSSLKENFPENWCLYLKINCVFLFPAVLITFLMQFLPIAEFLGSLDGFVVDVFGYLFLGYWILILLYFIFGVTYLHCALSFCFLLFFIYKMIKEKIRNRKLIFTFFSLTIVCIIFNIYWLIYAVRYMGV